MVIEPAGGADTTGTAAAKQAPGGKYRTDPGLYSFTGRHDHGELRPVRAGGPHERVALALAEAKAQTDAFLTAAMAREAAEQAAAAAEPKAPAKHAGGGADLMVVDGVGGGEGAAASEVGKKRARDEA